jgi:hypothetical protein
MGYSLPRLVAAGVLRSRPLSLLAVNEACCSILRQLLPRIRRAIQDRKISHDPVQLGEGTSGTATGVADSVPFGLLPASTAATPVMIGLRRADTSHEARLPSAEQKGQESRLRPVQHRGQRAGQVHAVRSWAISVPLLHPAAWLRSRRTEDLAHELGPRSLKALGIASASSKHANRL